MLLYPADHYFLDTEFYDPTRDTHPRNESFLNQEGNRMVFAVDFFSIGLVGDDGKEYYGVIKGINENAYRGHWVSDNVLAQLPPETERRTLEQIGLGLLKVFRKPENGKKRINIWARNGSYDNLILNRIFSGQLAFHALLQERYGIESVKYRDTNELINLIGPEHRLPKQEDGHHIAICDARYERDTFLAVGSILAHTNPSQVAGLMPHPEG